jgi:hypothetical protein
MRAALRIALVFLAAALLASALVALGADLWRWAGAGRWNHQPLGAYLFQIDPSVLPWLQAGVTEIFGRRAWNPVMTAILGWPAWVLSLPLGFLLLGTALSLRRDRPSRRDW